MLADAEKLRELFQGLRSQQGQPSPSYGGPSPAPQVPQRSPGIYGPTSQMAEDLGTGPGPESPHTSIIDNSVPREPSGVPIGWNETPQMRLENPLRPEMFPQGDVGAQPQIPEDWQMTGFTPQGGQDPKQTAIAKLIARLQGSGQ